MFYGPRPNSELLVHSGFVMSGNPHDYMLLKLGVGKNDPLKAQKETLLSASGRHELPFFAISRAFPSSSTPPGNAPRALNLVFAYS